MSLVNTLIDALSEYRDGYKRNNYQVPEHEIVINSKDYATLMDSRSAPRYVDVDVDLACAARNFGGAAIVLDDVEVPFVRDRTCDSSGPTE